MGDATLQDAYTGMCPPQVSNIEPPEGPETGGIQVTVFGDYLNNVETVLFGSTSAVIIETDPLGQYLICDLPAGTGLVDITLHVPAVGPTVIAQAFTYLPPPQIEYIDPAEGPLAGGNQIEVYGTNLRDTVQVDIGGVHATIVGQVTPTLVSVIVPAGAVPGPVDVAVNDEFGQGDTLASGYLYNALPTIETVAPSTGPAVAGTPVLITGTGFVSEPTVRFGASPAVMVDFTETQINCTAPAGTGTVDVTVDVPVAGTAVKSAAFTYIDPPAPVQIDPADGPVVGGISALIGGTNLAWVTAVRFGDSVASIEGTPADTSIQVTVPASGPGTVDIVVEDLYGQSSTLSAAFTFHAAPQLVSIEPTEGPLAGGGVLTLVGTNFRPTVAVFIGGVSAPIVGDVTPTLVTVLIPEGVSPGLTTVTVQDEFGQGNSLVDQYMYLPLPTITDVVPSAGPIAGGIPVHITGTGFIAQPAVQFGEAEATVSEFTETTVLCTAPAGAGTVDIVVDVPVAGTAVKPSAFAYIDPPAPASIVPNEGLVAGGTSATITGTNLAWVTSVRFGDDTASIETVPAESSVQVTVPASTTGIGLVDITVEDQFGQTGVLADAFTYLPMPPMVTEIYPDVGALAGEAAVTVTGQYFEPDAVVIIGGVAATDIVVHSETMITCTTPAHDEGVVDVTVEQSTGSTAVPVPYTYRPADLVLVSNSPIAMPAEFIDVNIDISNIGEPIAQALAFTMLYEHTVLIPVDDMDTEVDGHQIHTPGAAASATDKSVLSTVLEPGRVAVDVTGTTPAQIGDGALCTLHFRVADTAPRGRTSLDLTEFIAVAELGEPAAVAGIDGEAIVGSQPVIMDIVESTAWVDDTVVIAGSGFDADGSAEVYFDATPAAIDGLTETSITVTVPDQPGGTLDGQAVDVTVLNPAENLSATRGEGFTYVFVPPPPLITGLQPISGPETGSNSVTIEGDYLPDTGNISVTFGDTQASVQSVVDPHMPGSRVTVTVPAYAVGADQPVDVAVTNLTTTDFDVLAGGYTYTAVAPAVQSITPTVGMFATEAAIIGDHFDVDPFTKPTVMFGTVPATVVHSNAAATLSATSIPVIVPNGTGTVDVTVANPDSGLANSLDSAFTYAQPQLVSVTPEAGASVGGTQVNLVGDWFAADAEVTFGDTPALDITVLSPTTITCTTPPGLDTVDVTVSQMSGTAVLPAGFTYVEPLDLETSIR